MFYNVVLISAGQQCESVIILCIYILSLLSPPFSSHPIPLCHSECEAGLPVLYSSFPLAIYFTHDSVYMLMLLSQFDLPSSSPTVPTSPFSTAGSLFPP